MTSVRILWWVMGHVGYHFAFSIICFHVGKWSLQLLWQPYSRDRLQGSHIPLKFVFLWESSSSGHSGALWFKCFSPTREYLATIAPYQSILFAISIDPYHPLLPFTGPLPHFYITFPPPKLPVPRKFQDSRGPWGFANGFLKKTHWISPPPPSLPMWRNWCAKLAERRSGLILKTRPNRLVPQLYKNHKNSLVSPNMKQMYFNF